MAKAKAKPKQKSETPLMKQYHAIKAKHPGAVLLFRVGDFYETFGEDAVQASEVLGIVLTKRSNGSASEVALAGFPHHSLDTYLPKLVRAGLRVAVCDQLEDPKSVKGIVKRGVTELVTPGLSLNDNVLEQKQNNFLASLHFGKQNIGISFLDISTGEFFASQGDQAYIDKLLQSFYPSEVIYSKTRRDDFGDAFGDTYNAYCLDEWIFTHDFSYELLTSHFGTKNLKGYGIENLEEGVISSGAILHYLKETEHHDVSHISSIARLEEDKYVWLDKFTIRNLELVYPQFEGGVPLIDIVDSTSTPMGSRQLRKWMVLPLKDTAPINERLNLVEAFVKQRELLEEVRGLLKPIGDMERLISKVAVRRINPRELNQLKKALNQIVPIKSMLDSNSKTEEFKLLKKLSEQLHTVDFIREKVEAELKSDTPIVTNQGGIINDGINDELDELRKIAYSGKDFLIQIQQREIEATGIPSLKIAYNKVFGYYLEVSNTHKDKVPAEWIRKQTLTNAERYITEELKIYEDKILTAEEKIFAIEQRLYNDLVIAVADFIKEIQVNARTIATIDCLSSFAAVALANKYVKPAVTDEQIIDIKEGRHPVIEKQLPHGESYIPNDIFLDDSEQQVIIITGPNMAGKSALLRQTALVTLMAQMGCFVPAKAAKIGVVDKIFTRVGASDNLSRGESTFMVEMTETASILNNLSSRSLVLMDEIGRGTSTYDGISIAWSIVEYLHENPKMKAKTLFATHYHELNELTNQFPRVKNFNVSVKETGGKVVFMRKLKPGGSHHSFGIHVAQIAGMPNKVVLRANDILKHLEQDKVKDEIKGKVKDLPTNDFQMHLFESNDPNYQKAKKMMKELDINTISPVEALLKLNELKEMLKS